MSTPPIFTHDELVEIAERWLLGAGKCSFVLKELHTQAPNREIPDAIGFYVIESDSILIECKTSKSDFFSENRKVFRRHPELGMGSYRFYLAPSGLIPKNQLPHKWGLIEVGPKGKARRVVGPKGEKWSGQGWKFNDFSERSSKSERTMLASALRRVYLRGDMEKIYQKPWK